MAIDFGPQRAMPSSQARLQAQQRQLEKQRNEKPESHEYRCGFHDERKRRCLLREYHWGECEFE